MLDSSYIYISLCTSYCGSEETCSQNQERSLYSLRDVYTLALNTFEPFFVLEKKVTLIQHEQNVYYPLALAVVMLPISSVRYLWCFCLFPYLMSAYYTIQSLKRGVIFLPPLSVSLQCTICPAFLSPVLCLWALSVVHSWLFPPHFSLVPPFVLKKVQGSILGCIISSISCLTSSEHGQICLIFHLTKLLCQLATFPAVYNDLSNKNNNSATL